MDVTGTSGNDSLTGTEVDDFIRGLAGNDTLTGLGGNDTLDAGTGGDRLIGGTGNDTYIVDGPGDTVIENAGEGIDTVRTSASRTLDANVENLTLTGTAAISGIGNSLNNVLIGNSADNTLNGDTGADRLIGGAGNDTYVVDGPGDTVVENAGEGVDTVRSSASRTLEANVENLVLTGGFASTGTGNALNNVITGNIADNILNGGTGADRLIGGAGSDTYIVDGPGDVVVEYAGDQGWDAVHTSASRTLDANVESLVLTGTAAINGTGNALDNHISGNSAANVLRGGAGHDLYFVAAGDQVIENAGEGVDTVSSLVSFALAPNVEHLSLVGTAPVNGTGNVLNNQIFGNSAGNSISGGDGNDTLNGGGEADTLNGGLGNDVYLAGAGDLLIDAGGVDRVVAEIDWTLAAGFENLSSQTDTVVRLTGNNAGNVIEGSGAANLLSGLEGNDSLSDDHGNDTLLGGGGSDRLDGGFGDDVLTGGGSRDFFVFRRTPDANGVDEITDFVRGTDEVLLENAAFTALGATGAWASGDGRFRTDSTITTGQDSNDRLIYNTSTDSLYYDPDGSGPLGSQLIATFAGNPTLSASDITII